MRLARNNIVRRRPNIKTARKAAAVAPPANGLAASACAHAPKIKWLITLFLPPIQRHHSCVTMSGQFRKPAFSPSPAFRPVHSRFHQPVCAASSADAPVIFGNETPMSLTTPHETLEFYVLAVLTFYIELPDTPASASPLDEAWARLFFQRRIPLAVVEAALLLGSLRRRARLPDAPPLAGIRSLAYFQPIIEELSRTPVSESYRATLRQKMQRLCGPQPTSDVSPSD
jgi:hypothetical protein